MQFVCADLLQTAYVMTPLITAAPDLTPLITMASQGGPFGECSMGLLLFIPATRKLGGIICLGFHIFLSTMLCGLLGEVYVLDLNVFCCLQVVLYALLLSEPEAPSPLPLMSKQPFSRQKSACFVVALTGLRYMAAFFSSDANHDYAMDLYGKQPVRQLFLRFDQEAPETRNTLVPSAQGIIPHLEKNTGMYRIKAQNSELVAQDFVRFFQRGNRVYIWDTAWYGTDEFPTTLTHAVSLGKQVQEWNGNVSIGIYYQPRVSLQSCTKLTGAEYMLAEADEPDSKLSNHVANSHMLHQGSLGVMLIWIAAQCWSSWGNHTSSNRGKTS
jgi:hypothetical protein